MMVPHLQIYRIADMSPHLGTVKSRMERLYEIISKPKVIYSAEDPSQPNNVVLTYETTNGAPIIVPIEPNHQVVRIGCVNRIASVYEKRVGGRNDYPNNGNRSLEKNWAAPSHENSDSADRLWYEMKVTRVHVIYAWHSRQPH